MRTSRIRKAVDWIVGLALIAIGVVFGFLPVLQGWIFVLAGLAVLSSHSRWARTIHDRIKTLAKEAQARITSRRDPPR